MLESNIPSDGIQSLHCWRPTSTFPSTVLLCIGQRLVHLWTGFPIFPLMTKEKCELSPLVLLPWRSWAPCWRKSSKDPSKLNKTRQNNAHQHTEVVNLWTVNCFLWRLILLYSHRKSNTDWQTGQNMQWLETDIKFKQGLYWKQLSTGSKTHGAGQLDFIYMNMYMHICVCVRNYILFKAPMCKMSYPFSIWCHCEATSTDDSCIIYHWSISRSLAGGQRDKESQITSWEKHEGRF